MEKNQYLKEIVPQQELRVVKGWFPENPKRHEYYEALRRNLKK